MMARLVGMLGELPPYMLQEGQYAGAFFTKSGRVYERDAESGLFQVGGWLGEANSGEGGRRGGASGWNGAGEVVDLDRSVKTWLPAPHILHPPDPALLTPPLPSSPVAAPAVRSCWRPSAPRCRRAWPARTAACCTSSGTCWWQTPPSAPPPSRRCATPGCSTATARPSRGGGGRRERGRQRRRGSSKMKQRRRERGREWRRAWSRERYSGGLERPFAVRLCRRRRACSL